MQNPDNTILIADAGGTSTSWALIAPRRNVHPLRFRTDPLNAALLSEQEFFAGLQPVIDELHGITPSKIYFYGAGCATRSIISKVGRVLAETFTLGDEQAVEVKSDLQGAAVALFGRQPGIAAILGTGSASCLWDGSSIALSTPSLGYILGDEGSGADMGKRLLNAYFKRRLSPETLQIVRDATGDISLQQTLQATYRRPLANSWLASFAQILIAEKENEELRKIAEDSIRSFFDANVEAYRSHPQFVPEIGFVGSIAFHLRDIVETVASSHGLKLSRAVQSPMDLLIDYHSQTQ